MKPLARHFEYIESFQQLTHYIAAGGGTGGRGGRGGRGAGGGRGRGRGCGRGAEVAGWVDSAEGWGS